MLNFYDVNCYMAFEQERLSFLKTLWQVDGSLLVYTQIMSNQLENCPQFGIEEELPF